MTTKKSEHTPGPWEISGGTNKKGELYIWRKARPGIIDGGAIAAVLHHYAPAELAANATLIAAAPELLAALEAMVFNETMKSGAIVTANGIRAARAAIAKAKKGE